METSAKTAFRFTERKGFTLAELLVAITIVAALSAVAVTYGNSYKAAQSNSMRLSHIETLKTAADGYRLAKGDYPEPKANSVRFSADGAYRHSGSGAYGVSSKASSDLFGAEFLSNVPSDPETGAFYGYGKRLDGTLGYDFATVDKVGDVFVAYVRGTYDASSLTSLIREHNGPGFVENGKSDRLPYDPYKTSITGKINNSSGTVTVNAGAKSPTAVIEEGDTIGTIAGGSAIVFLSDGTELNIGSPTQASELKFEELSVADPKGFLTKVRLALNSGEAWAKAPKLREAGDGRSELQMESGGAVASVRGTVFGMRKDPLVAGTTKIMLAEGSIVITKENGDPIPNYTSSTGTLSVPEGATPVTTDVIGGTSATTPTASGGLVEKKKKWNAKGMRLPVKIKKIVRVGNSYTISFDNPDGLPTAYGEILYDGGANGWPLPTWGSLSPVLVFNDLAAVGAIKSFKIELYKQGFEGLNSPYQSYIKVPQVSEGDFDITLPERDSDPVSGCAPGKSRFAAFGCQDERLVAFAPYEDFSTEAGVNENGGLLFFKRRGEPVVPITNSTCSGTPYQGGYIHYKQGFQRGAPDVGGIAFNQCGISEQGKMGVVIDNLYNDQALYLDYLAYETSALPINPISAEVVVGITGKGANADYNRYLYQFGNGIGIKFSTGVTMAGTRIDLLNSAWTSIAGLNYSFNVEKNYQISTRFFKGNVSFSIAQDDCQACPITESDWVTLPLGSINSTLYVGSKARTVANPNNLEQWGTVDSYNVAQNIIDYVKIYSSPMLSKNFSDGSKSIAVPLKSQTIIQEEAPVDADGTAAPAPTYELYIGDIGFNVISRNFDGTISWRRQDNEVFNNVTRALAINIGMSEADAVRFYDAAPAGSPAAED